MNNTSLCTHRHRAGAEKLEHVCVTGHVAREQEARHMRSQLIGDADCACMGHSYIDHNYIGHNYRGRNSSETPIAPVWAITI